MRFTENVRMSHKNSLINIRFSKPRGLLCRKENFDSHFFLPPFGHPNLAISSFADRMAHYQLFGNRSLNLHNIELNEIELLIGKSHIKGYLPVKEDQSLNQNSGCDPPYLWWKCFLQDMVQQLPWWSHLAACLPCFCTCNDEKGLLTTFPRWMIEGVWKLPHVNTSHKYYEDNQAESNRHQKGQVVKILIWAKTRVGVRSGAADFIHRGEPSVAQVCLMTAGNWFRDQVRD